MLLRTVTDGRSAFNVSAIMRRAFQLGRFALQLCRTAAERNRQRSLWLRKAWAEAKCEAREFAHQRQRRVEMRAVLAASAKDSAAVAASLGNNPIAIQNALLRETMRDRMNFAAVARLEAALVAVIAAKKLY
jgi:methylphosphotriester-DNA--protein-cysteine methyltransferase